MPKHHRRSAGGRPIAATLRSEIYDISSQLSSELLRAALEPTVLSLETASESAGCPLSLSVAAPRAINACNLELEIDQPWCSPFRMVRVVVRLPADIASLDSTDFGAAIKSLILNMKVESTLETVVRVRDFSTGPRSNRCVLIEIPVPVGITLRPGAAISLSVSIAGSPITLRIPAASHIHSATCNHKTGRIGAVWRAACVGDAAALEAALATGGSTEEGGITALGIAAREGHAKAVRILLAAGADVKSDGWTPLHLAAEGGHLLIVQTLLRDPLVNPGARNNNGNTPLDLAAEGGYTAIVQALLGDPRVDAGESDEMGCVSLHWAAQEGRTDIVQALLRDPRVAPGARNKDGWTALDLAAERGYTTIVQALLGHPRVDPGESGKNGWTPLHLAAEAGRAPVVQALLGDPRVNPGERNLYGETPLYLARREGHVDVVMMLEAAGRSATAPKARWDRLRREMYS